MAHDKIAADKIKQETNGRMEITHLSQQRARRRHRDDLAGDLRRAGDVQPAGRSAGAAQSGLRHSGVGFAFPDYGPCLGGDGRRTRQHAARRGGADRPLLPGQGLRPRLPPDHHADQADHQPRRPARLQDPPAGGAVSDFAVPPSRRLADRDQLQRGIQRVADRHRRRAGKPAGADRHRQAVRGAEILQPDQPCLVRLPRRVQRRRVEAAAAGPAGDGAAASSPRRRWRSGRTS